MQRDDLVEYLNRYLNIESIKDYGPQGLQVESDNSSIDRIALAVDVSPAIIEAAADWKADMLLVHHGLFWGSVERIAGPLGARVRALMAAGINLYAAHLPLDAHPEIGNNAVLAQMFGMSDLNWWCEPKGTPIGVYGDMEIKLPLDQFVDQVNEKLNTQSRVLANGSDRVRKLAILSGFGADKVGEAKALGVDTFLTGEMSHANYWASADFNINVIFAGHYATETVGVKALGDLMTNTFGIETKFFDFPTRM